MHEIRSQIENGGRRDIVVRKDAARGDQPKPAGLTRIAIPRKESRQTNQRREDRHLNVADCAVVIFRRKRVSVEIINVSSHGVMIQSDIEPRLGERMDIRFEDCNRTACTVRWVKDRRIGLEFAIETVLIVSPEVREMIVSGRRSGEQRPKLEIKGERLPRHSLFWQGVLYHGNESPEVRVRNISARGAMCDCSGDIWVGAAVVLELAGTAANAIAGRVRWCQSGQIGVLFDQLFDMSILAEAAPSRTAKAPVPGYLKPDYLRSESDPESPWAARTYGLRAEDL